MKKADEKSITSSLDDRVDQMARALLLMRRMQDKTAAEFLASLGSLSLQQLAVLNIVGDNEPCTMSEIAKKASLSLSSITIIVDKLVKDKLMKRIRSEEDRRVVRAALTTEGRKIYQVQIERVHKVIQRLFTILTSEEQEQLVKVLQKIAQLAQLAQ